MGGFHIDRRASEWHPGRKWFRRISRRQASQLPRRCDIPAAWAFKGPRRFLLCVRPGAQQITALPELVRENADATLDRLRGIEAQIFTVA